jgi:two-component system, NarL family, sensor histidine kinase DesK
MRLLPPDRDHGWVPFVWLVYFGWFFVHPIMDHVGWKEWLATGIAAVVFPVLYFAHFWIKGRWSFLTVAGILLLGVLYIPSNPGAGGFFIYAAAFAPFLVETELPGAGLVALVIATLIVESFIVPLSGISIWPFSLMAFLIGAGNVYFAQRNRNNRKLKRAQQEVEHLAKVAERERIARDLHDVLGHTLSVIILKSELAGKLISRDPERARAEMKDVETTSRAALADVRNTIRGYRAQSLEAELKQSLTALETAGVSVQAHTAEISLTPAQESVVAMVVREAVTNVVRHAGARNCQVHLSSSDGTCLLEIRDDGTGGSSIEGNGLRGMRERIEALGGNLQRQISSGTKLTIRFPLAAATGNGGH